MKIIVAPDSFKGSLCASDAAAAIAEGVRRAAPGADIHTVPVSDGGDGLVDVLCPVLGGEILSRQVSDPLGRPVKARFCWVAGRSLAVVEMAEASGLALLHEHEQDPMRTSTAGTGELVAQALELGARQMIIGVGGSATCDGGTGMASALGVRFHDEEGRDLDPTGGSLEAIAGIDPSGLNPALKGMQIKAACDVCNPLLGERGAARVYAPQKGAAPAQVCMLESGLANLACRMRDDLGADVTALRHGGAAGGLGAGLHVFLGAELVTGVDLVLDLVRLDLALDSADLVITGEGVIDRQTLFHKAPAGVCSLAGKKSVKCIAVCGNVDEADMDELHAAGFAGLYPICTGSVALEDAMANAPVHLSTAAERAVRAFLGEGE